MYAQRVAEAEQYHAIDDDQADSPGGLFNRTPKFVSKMKNLHSDLNCLYLDIKLVFLLKFVGCYGVRQLIRFIIHFNFVYD
jgi:hypothetical protein